MADSFQNPQTRAEMAKLEAELQGIKSEFAATRQAIESQGAAAAEDRAAARAEAAKVRQETKTRQKIGGAAAGSTEPSVLARVAAAADEVAKAQLRATAAVEARLAMEQKEVQTLGAAARVQRAVQGPLTPAATAQAQVQAAALRAQADRVDQALNRVIASSHPIGQRQLPGPGQTANLPISPYAGPVTPYNPNFTLGGQPPPRPPPTGGVDVNSDRVKFSERDLALLEEAQKRAAKFGSATRGVSDALSYESAQLAASSTQYQRHGALTTEFISAAARGEVTIRELGSQIGQTIGKFAGWTGAAAATYGALGAIQALGKGAIDSVSGVAQLSRVLTGGINTDKLQASFRDLATEFNVPIDTAVQAVYGAGKTFNDQAEAIKAARATLLAVQTAELKPDQANLYLNAIANGFQLTKEGGDSLVKVLDAVNQATNRFGGNTGSLVQGTAKAAGQFRAAGGNYRELVALLETGSKLTGSTPNEVATAVARSAGRVQTEAGVKRLREVGLNPDQPIQKLYDQAIAEAAKAGPGIAGQRRVQELARALVPQGGQFARIFVPLLQNPQLLRKVYGALDPNVAAPGGAKGSAERELKQLLQGADQQIKKLGVDLQALGGALAQSGLLTPLLGLVKALDLGITSTTHLLSLFKDLAGPLAPVLGTLLEIAAVIKLARRFDLGGDIGRSQGGLRGIVSRSPDQLIRADVNKGLIDQERYFQQEVYNARARVVSGRVEVDAAERASVLAVQRNVVATEQIAMEQRVLSAKRTLAAAADREAILAESLAVTQAQRATFRTGLKSGLAPAEAAAAAGIAYRPGTLERPSLGNPARVGSPGQLALFGSAAAEEEKAAAGKVAEEAKKSGIAAGAARTAGSAALGAIKTAGTGIVAAAVGIRAIAVTQVGLLDGVLLAAIAIPLLVEDSQSRLDELKSQLDKISSNKGGPAGIKNRVEDARKKGLGLIGDIEQGFADVVNFFPGSEQSKLVGPGDVKSATDAAGKARAAEASSLARAQKGGREKFLSSIQSDLKRSLTGVTDAGQIRALYDRALGETANSHQALGGYSTSNPAKAKATARRFAEQLREQLAAALTASGDLDGVLKNLEGADQKGLADFFDRQSANFSLRLPSQRNYRTSATELAATAQQYAGGKITAKDAASDFDRITQEAESQAQQELQRKIQLAKSPAEQGRARGRYTKEISEALVTGPAKRIRDLQQDIEDAQKQEGVGTLGQRLGKLTGLSDRIKRDRDQIRVLKSRLGLNEREVSALIQAQDRAQFEAEQAVYDASTQLQVARTHDPVAAAKLTLSRQNARLSSIASQYGKHSTQYLQALTAAEQDQQAVVQAQLQVLDAQTNLSASFTGDPIAAAQIQLGGINQKLQILSANGLQNTVEYIQALASAQQQQKTIVDANISRYQAYQGLARAGANIDASPLTKLKGALSDAQNFLGFISSQPYQDPATIINAQKAVVDARSALADYYRQQAQALVTARAALATSRTEDPIKQAQIALKAAEQQVKFAQTPSDRINAEAEVNNRRRALQQTIYSERFSQIEFDASIQKIDHETEISRLQSLLKTIKGDRDLRRQIQQRIFDLKHQASSSGNAFGDLHIGDIKLPTTYEIRRAVQGGLDASRRVHVVNSPQVNVYPARGREAEVGAVLDKHLNTSTKQAFRAAGLT